MRMYSHRTEWSTNIDIGKSAFTAASNIVTAHFEHRAHRAWRGALRKPASGDMRHTVVIDDKLLQDAKLALGTTGVRETIEAGLKEAVRKRRLEELRRSLGTWDLDLTQADLDRMRNDS